jgi:hypothetical protein
LSQVDRLDRLEFDLSSGPCRIERQVDRVLARLALISLSVLTQCLALTSALGSLGEISSSTPGACNGGGTAIYNSTHNVHGFEPEA